jgi:DNA-binding NarL/FixJ family response regulator
MSETEAFISHLYRATKRVDIEYYRQWALNELQSFLDIDAAIWSTGHLSTRTFHTHTTLNLPTSFPDTLIEHIKINPISNSLFAHAGEAVDMADVINDSDFYRSEIYHSVFEPHGIKRILSSLHIASRSGIYTLLSVYRTDKDRKFSDNEKKRHQRVLFHLIQAASHACMLSMEDRSEGEEQYYAICDRHGIYHEVETEFLDIVDLCFKGSKELNTQKQILPLKLPLNEQQREKQNYIFSSQQLGDLFRIGVRQRNKLDQLTQRELDVVKGVTKGLSFKLIAKQLGLSPSTISNHLYRIYHKLNINSREQLAQLMGDIELK